MNHEFNEREITEANRIDIPNVRGVLKLFQDEMLIEVEKCPHCGETHHYIGLGLKPCRKHMRTMFKLDRVTS